MFSIKKANSWLNLNKHIGILLLRLFVGFRILYGVLDNVLSWNKMIEFSKFLNQNNFPFSLISAVTSVYFQFFCSILIIIGFKIRYATFILIINFLVALIFVHLKANDTIEGMTPVLAMLFGCFTLLFTGADKISIDHYCS
jgi:putative oxidoreductase